MNAETLRELVRRQPFEPLEIRTTNGDVPWSKHPEMAILVGNRLVVGHPEADRIAIHSRPHAAGTEIRQTA